MSIRRILLLSLMAAVLAACTGGSGTSAPPSGSAAASPSGPAAAMRIDVTLTDALKIEPASLTVPAGAPVIFVVKNTGSTEHEFYLGDEAAQNEHEEEMRAGSMMHDDPNGISLAAGETKELTHSFEAAGETLAGCHVAGHYAAGMKAAITVTG